MDANNDHRKAAAVAEIASMMKGHDKREILTAIIRAYQIGYRHAEDDYSNNKSEPQASYIDGN